MYIHSFPEHVSVQLAAFYFSLWLVCHTLSSIFSLMELNVQIHYKFPPFIIFFFIVLFIIYPGGFPMFFSFSVTDAGGGG